MLVKSLLRQPGLGSRIFWRFVLTRVCNPVTFRNLSSTLIGITGCLTDSPKDPTQAHKLACRFSKEVSEYLVADRMLMTRVSWQDLDDAGYVFGTEVFD